MQITHTQKQKIVCKYFELKNIGECHGLKTIK